METSIFLDSNVKFLRIRENSTQQSLAEALSISRSKLNCIETGQTKSPLVEDILKFSDYFKISVDTLIKVDLSKLGELKIRELQAGNDIYIKGGNLRVLAITVDKENNENVEFVPVKAKAGYSSGYNDPEYIASLPKYSIPGLPKQGSFRIFPTSGDSMLPIPEGSEVVGRFVENWKTIKADTPCIVILKNNQDFVFKLVKLQKDKGFLLSSLNSFYKTYEVAVEDVLEIWEFYSFSSKKIPENLPDLPALLEEIQSFGEKIRTRLEKSGIEE